MSNNDNFKWTPKATVFKWEPETVLALQDSLGFEPVYADFVAAGVEPDDIAVAEGNLLTTAGLNRITNLIIGGGAQAFNNSRAVVGVGATATAATVGDTALAGNGNSTTAWYQAADASNPSQANGVITCNATFASADANFAWNEWCWGVATAAVTASATFNTASTTGIMLNRKVQSLGTKVSGAVWTLQSTVTLV